MNFKKYYGIILLGIALLGAVNSNKSYAFTFDSLMGNNKIYRTTTEARRIPPEAPPTSFICGENAERVTVGKGYSYLYYNNNEYQINGYTYYCVNPGDAIPRVGCKITRSLSEINGSNDSLEKARASIITGSGSAHEKGDALNILSCKLTPASCTKAIRDTTRHARMTVAGNAIWNGDFSGNYGINNNINANRVNLVKNAFDVYRSGATIDSTSIVMSVKDSIANCEAGLVSTEIVLKVDSSKIANFDPNAVKFFVVAAGAKGNLRYKYVEYSDTYAGYLYEIAEFPLASWSTQTTDNGKKVYAYTIETHYDAAGGGALNGTETITFVDATVQRLYTLDTSMPTNVTGGGNSAVASLEIKTACKVPDEAFCYVDGILELSYYKQYLAGTITLDDFINVYKCCVPLETDLDLRATTLDKDKNNLYIKWCQFTCFTGENSLENQHKNGAISDQAYADACCEPDGKDKMGTLYDKLCTPNKECPNLLDPIECTQEADSGLIYEIEEKGITVNNYECLMDGVDYKGNTFDQTEFGANRYCRVLCKEDVDLYFQGWGWNPKNTGNQFLIKAGTYFKFKPYDDGTKKYENMPAINQQRSCLSKMYIETFTLDLYGVKKKISELSTINANNVNGGFYGAAANAAKLFYAANESLPGAESALASANAISCTSEVNIAGCEQDKAWTVSRAESTVNQLKSQISSSQTTYGQNVKNINNAIAELKKCHEWTNEYDEADLGKAEQFFYFEMKHPKEEIKNALEKLDLEIETSEITSTDKVYCTNTLECNQSLKTNSMPTLSGGQLSYPGPGASNAFLTGLRKTDPVDFYEMSKNQTNGDINYELGLELYSLKPTGLTVTTDHDDLAAALDNNTYNYLGRGLPINLDTFGKSYNYDFEITRLSKDNRLLDLFHSGILGGEPKYVCRYVVGNQIVCPPIKCPDPWRIDCPPIECPDIIADPTTQVIYRPVDSSDINPNNRTLGPNFTDAKGVAAIERMKNKGETIYNEEAMYSFIGGPKELKEIREYNKNESYSNFDLKCADGGVRCESSFVTKYADKTNLDASRDKYLEFDESTNQFEYK